MGTPSVLSHIDVLISLSNHVADFGMSSTGKELYIYGAGYDIEVYDPATLKLRSTIDLQADQTTGMIVVPGK